MVVTGIDLGKLSRTDGPSYDDPFWVALGHLGAEQLCDMLESGLAPPNEVFPSWQEADSVATHDKGRYPPFQPGDVLLSFEAQSYP